MGIFGGRLLAAGLIAAIGVGSAAAEDAYRLLSLEGSLLKWGAPATGTPAQVTYALVDRPVSFRGARNCAAMKPLEPVLLRNRVGKDRFLGELRAAFDAWTRAADITFTPAVSAATADILIGAQIAPRGRAFTNVDFNASDKGATRSLSRSLICLNPEMPWKVGFDGNLNIYDLRYTLMHEIGHAIGLDHPGSSHEVMSFKYREAARDLQPGDRIGATALYGQSRMAGMNGDAAPGRHWPVAGPAMGSSLSLGGDDTPAPKRR